MVSNDTLEDTVPLLKSDYCYWHKVKHIYPKQMWGTFASNYLKLYRWRGQVWFGPWNSSNALVSSLLLTLGLHREAKETQQLHKSLQLCNDKSNFVQMKRILHNDLLFICSENLNMIGWQTVSILLHRCALPPVSKVTKLISANENANKLRWHIINVKAWHD